MLSLVALFACLQDIQTTYPAGDALRRVPSPPPLSSHQPSPDPGLEPVIDHPPPLAAYQTLPNDVGLFQVYPTRPSFIPKGGGDIHAVVDAPSLEASQRSEAPEQIALESRITPETLYSAFSSPTAGLLMCWQYSGTNEKSGAELNRLRSYAIEPQFKPSVQSAACHRVAYIPTVCHHHLISNILIYSESSCPTTFKTSAVDALMKGHPTRCILAASVS